MGETGQYRYIIDCLLNLPLLFWASRETGEPRYRDIALAHLRTTLANSIRPDWSTYHTFFMDPETGAPLHGATKQGYRDDSSWTRGQAWAFTGLAFCHRHAPSADYVRAFDRLLAYYRMAEVCIITPLRDGLNLVAKEYVAAKGDKPGALVLSEFTGCAVEFPQAILTNPYSTRAMDAAIDRALDMPADEARSRMQAMQEVVRRYDVGHWVDHTFDRFGEIGGPRGGARMAAVGTAAQ